jgi:hypothetical protein
MATEEEGSKNALYSPKVLKPPKPITLAECAEKLQLFRESLAIFEAKPPYAVPLAEWKQAVEDGRRLVLDHGTVLTALGWPPKQVFGLAGAYEPRIIVPERVGLAWYIHGGQVLALSAGFCVIRRPDGLDISYCWWGRKRPA